MVVDQNNRKQLIEFLLNRWQFVMGGAAVEKVYVAMRGFAKDNNLPLPQVPQITIPQACRQIEVIKHRIIEILPEAKFIDYSFEAQAPLNPDDFVEVFVADHQQCIGKVRDIIKKMKIT